MFFLALPVYLAIIVTEWLNAHLWQIVGGSVALVGSMYVLGLLSERRKQR